MKYLVFVSLMALPLVGGAESDHRVGGIADPFAQGFKVESNGYHSYFLANPNVPPVCPENVDHLRFTIGPRHDRLQEVATSLDRAYRQFKEANPWRSTSDFLRSSRALDLAIENRLSFSEWKAMVQMTPVKFGSGFASVQEYNDALKKHFESTYGEQARLLKRHKKAEKIEGRLNAIGLAQQTLLKSLVNEKDKTKTLEQIKKNAELIHELEEELKQLGPKIPDA